MLTGAATVPGGSVRLLALAVLGVVAGPAKALDLPDTPGETAYGALCPPGPPSAPLTLEPPDDPDSTAATADRATREGPITTLEGEAELAQTGRAVGSEFMRLDRSTQTATLREQIFLTTDELLVKAERGELDLDSGAFELSGVRYHQRLIGAQGVASRVEDDGSDQTRLHSATFSTCPRQKQDWHLAASSVNLDRENNVGTAWNARMHFFDVPVFYTPWIRFSLDDERTTGFLAPRFGSSSDSGTMVSTPFYWNIAPNFDATLTPTYFSDRGVRFGSQWRWLNRQGSWVLENQYLPDDRKFGDERVLTRVEHDGRLGDSWTTSIDATEVSDSEYFDDLDGGLDVGSETFLLRRADLRWRGNKSNFLARVQNFRTVDDSIAEANEPFEQLPRLEFNGRDYDMGAVAVDLESEAIQWEGDGRTDGTRLRFTPAVRAPIERPGWFVRPRLALDYTHYELDRVEGDPGRDSIDRALPITSVDAGLRFDRPAGRFRQTLEPRLFYVHIPDDGQNDIPLFDTGEFDFSFGQLFRERRFTGGDRIGDDNRLTLALTTRLLERDDGREFLRASIGGLQRFTDRAVGLRSDAPPDRNTSDIIGELAFSPNRNWSVQTTLQWDPENDETKRRNASLRYRGDGGTIANLGLRQRFTADGDTEQDQIDGSFAWPVNTRWSLFGRLFRSLESGRNLDSLLGVEYRSCCWSLRAVAREEVDDFDEEEDRSISIQLVLRGLGGVGQDTGGLLERAILGFDDPETNNALP